MFDLMLCVLSLSEVNDDLVMWGTYSDSYSGYVIGFNSEHDFFKPNFQLRKVNYRSNRPEIVVGEIWDITFHLTKSIRWIYEQEWRFITRISSGIDINKNDKFGYPIIVFDIPPEAINQIILGARMLSVDQDQIIDSVKNNPSLKHVKIFRSSIDSDVFRINIDKKSLV